jgi:hypothetical protein
MAGHPAAWTFCSEGSTLDSGHTDLTWTQGPVVYTVSLHGHSDLNKELALALAENLHPISKP